MQPGCGTLFSTGCMGAPVSGGGHGRRAGTAVRPLWQKEASSGHVLTFTPRLRASLGSATVALKKKSAKSRKISSKAAYIPVADPFGRCGRAPGLFRDMYSGPQGVYAPGLLEGE